ncbi:MAG: beta-galactosidase [Defluviitaleaceae bacterium]|nr:beta-galactosidase [Defluviitaleaceae bacterium]
MNDRLLHGGDYNPDQWLDYPSILADDIRFMKDAKTNAFSVGIFAWAALEPTEGNFNFQWLDKIMDDIHGFGGKVLLATPSAARPAWLAQKYPEVLRTNNLRQKMLFGARHNHCFSSPVYREKVGIINRKLAERYKNHPALYMWHVSNEYNGECHCEYCRENFRKWLKDKYQTIDNLNHAYWSAFWSHTFNDFSQIDPPSPLGEFAVHNHNLDWKRFISYMTIDFYLNEVAPLKEITPDIPLLTNFMGELFTRGTYPSTGVIHSDFAREVDVVTWDAYPAWHNDYETTAFTASKLAYINDFYRSLKGKPFLILESTPSMVNWHPINRPKRPGMHLLSSLGCVAHGADGIMYFQWRKSRGSSEKFHGAVVDHDNSGSNRVYKDVKELGHVLESIKEIKDTSTPAKVALIYDVENFWALSDAQGFNNIDKQYHQTMHTHYRAFWTQNIPVDVITPDKDLTRYDLVVAPMLYMASKELITKLHSYVKNGGTLVATYMLGIVNENDLVYLGGLPSPLKEIFGINIGETDSLYPTQKNALIMSCGKEYEAFDHCAIFDVLPGTEVLATYGSDFYKGNPALTRNAFDKGQAYFIGPRTGEDFLVDFYSGLIKADLPINGDEEVSIQERRNEKNRYFFVMNYSEEEKEISLETAMEDIITRQEMTAGKHRIKPYGVFVLKH